MADYLAEEMLWRQPPQVRDFLMRTSVLEQLEAGICDFVLERRDSAAVLAGVETPNAMLVRVGESEPPSYRYHSMFGGFLRQQLARELPEAASVLHRRAAQCYLAQQRPIPAIDHALEGGDLDMAAELIDADAAQLLAQGRMRIPSRWLEALPPAVFEARPELMAVRIWALCFTRGSHEAAGLLASTRDHLFHDLAGAAVDALDARIGVMRVIMYSFMKPKPPKSCRHSSTTRAYCSLDQSLIIEAVAVSSFPATGR